MSWKKTVILECDHEGCTMWIDTRRRSVAPGRLQAWRWGWAHRSGRDLCPEHARDEAGRAATEGRP